MTWPTKRLGEVCELKPQKKEARTKLRESDLVSFVPMEDLGIQTKDLTLVQEKKLKEVSGSYTYFADGDVLMAKITPCFENGKLGIANGLKNGIGFGSSEFVVFRPKKEINSEYLYYFLSGDEFREKGRRVMSGAVGHKRVPKEFIDNYEIPLPPLSTQLRIVSILDSVFSSIAVAKENTEKNLQNSRELFESYLQSVFEKPGKDWQYKKIGEIAQHSLGKMLDKAKNRGKLQPYLRNFNVRWFSFDLSDISQMPFLPEESTKYTAIKGDVLICEGGYPGRAAIWNEDYPIYFQKALHRVRFHEPIHNKWFIYYLYAQDKSGELKQHFSGTGIQHFTGEVLDRFELPLPPLSEVRRMVAKFDSLSTQTKKLESLYKQKLANLEELKKSVLKKAFSGEL